MGLAITDSIVEGVRGLMGKRPKDDAAEAQRRIEQSAAAKVWSITPPPWMKDEIDHQRRMMEDRIEAEMRRVKENQYQRQLEERFHRGDEDITYDIYASKYHERPKSPPKRFEKYHDPVDGMWKVREVGMGEFVPVEPPKNAIKPVVHKAGHFPTDWMIEAYERGQQSDVLITIQIEKDGVVVIGEEGEAYETITLSWLMMEKAMTNPVVIGIETVEKHLATLANLKQRVKVGSK